MTDDTWDEAFIASAFVSWHTEPAQCGSYIPMTEKEASRIFFDWLRKVKADAWDEAHGTPCDEYTRDEMCYEYHRNPYRD